MTIFGTQQILRFFFYAPTTVLGSSGREVVVNGLALIVVGTPIWVYAWRLIQDSLVDPAEMGSNLRLGILYVLALGGVITVITAAWMVINTVLNFALGQGQTFSEMIREIGDPISIGLPLGMVWAYYKYWLDWHVAGVGDPIRQAGMKRLYNYILSFIGLVVTFIGVATLLNFLIDIVTHGSLSLSVGMREVLTASIASLVVGIPLWILMWRPMQAEAMAPGEMGDHARRSVLRKAYLYLALFASVIGGMGTAVGLVYELIRVVLNVQVSDFLNTVLNLGQLLFLFGIVLVYHLNVLRADGASTADALAQKQGDYSLLIVDSGDGFVEAVQAALAKLGSKMQVVITNPDIKPEGNFNSILLNGDLAVNAPEWIRSFDGSKVVVQNESKDIVWTEDALGAAQSVQKLAEGQQIQKQKTTRSPWTIVIYVFAALFALQLLFLLLALGISLVVR
jgi:hypothetical protein